LTFKRLGKYNSYLMLTKLKEKLARTRKTFKDRFDELLQSNKKLEEILDDLTETMILADVGPSSTEKIINNIKQKCKKTDTFQKVKKVLEDEIIQMLSRHSPEMKLSSNLSVVLMVGVNGGGKTTSIAKLACLYKQKGKNILLVAADTFRAAAQEQLVLWGKKLEVPVVKGQYGADPASVVYDAIQSSRSRQSNLLLIDSAGRIHTNTNLMQELEKIKRVIEREIEGAPQEILLVLDASTGQNALIQAREFLKFSGITGVFLTKLDGTAKGGSVISIVDELNLPVKFMGIGEGEKDMLHFSPEEFARALLS